MAADQNEMKGLMRRHVGIRAQLEFLTRSLTRWSKEKAPLKDLIWGYRHNLLDFQEIVRQHIKLDERIIGPIVSGDMKEQLAKEHALIRSQIKEVIALANDAVNSELNQEEQYRYASDIREAVHKIFKLIETHTAREDELLQARENAGE